MKIKLLLIAAIGFLTSCGGNDLMSTKKEVDKYETLPPLDRMESRAIDYWRSRPNMYYTNDTSYQPIDLHLDTLYSVTGDSSYQNLKKLYDKYTQDIGYAENYNALLRANIRDYKIAMKAFKSDSDPTHKYGNEGKKFTGVLDDKYTDDSIKSISSRFTDIAPFNKTRDSIGAAMTLREVKVVSGYAVILTVKKANIITDKIIYKYKITFNLSYNIVDMDAINRDRSEFTMVGRNY